MSKGILWILSLCLSVQVFASLEDHLRQVENKGLDHRFGNIDFVYVINLDERPEKFLKTCVELEPWGVHPYRFSAVNGWKLSSYELNEVGVKIEKGMNTNLNGLRFTLENEICIEKPLHIGSVYFTKGMTRGAIGIVLSHLSILKDAYDSGYETIWVLEDDIVVIRSPSLLPELVDKLDTIVGKDNWDILFTDPDTKDVNGSYVRCLAVDPRPNFSVGEVSSYAYQKKITKDFKKVKARYGAYSMIVRRSGMKKILDFYKSYNIFSAYDCDYFVVPNIIFYSLNYDVVSVIPDAPSDNREFNYDPIRK